MSNKRAKATQNLAAILGTVAGEDNLSIVLPETTAHSSGQGSGGALVLSVEAIRPDANQPRSLLPDGLYARLFAGDDPVSVLLEWQNRAEDDQDATALRKIQGIRRLADTIEAHGLIQPITVRLPEDKPQYVIVTGERRWWAHLLLTAEERAPFGQSMGTITVVESRIEPNAIHAVQLIENLQREDLTVVETARGLQALHAELNRFSPTSWGTIEDGLGISTTSRKDLMALLKLSREVLSLVDAHNLPEGAIRPIARELGERPDLQLTAVRQQIAWREEGTYTVARFQAFIAALLQEGEGGKAPAAPATFDVAVWTTNFGKQLGKTFKLLQVNDANRAEVTQALRSDPDALAQWQDIRQQLDDAFGIS